MSKTKDISDDSVSSSSRSYLKRYVVVLSLLFLFVGISSCDLINQAEEGSDAPEAVELGQPNPPTLNEQFAQVADSLPSFGGFYLNEVGEPTAYFMEPDQLNRSEVERVLKNVMGEDILKRGAGPRRDVQNPQLNMRQGVYPMDSLLTWYDRMGEVFSVDDVVFTDLQERNNSLTVGMTSFESEQDVEGILEDNEIPREAVSIIEADLPSVEGHGLRSNVNPPRGGIEIGYPTGSSTVSLCSFGFVGRLNGDFGFITNSHCTAQRGSVTGRTFNNPASGPQLGSETADPNYSTCGFFQNSACRYSDAAFVDFDSGINGIEKVAQTQGWAGPNSGSGNRQIAHGNSNLDIRGYDTYPVNGEMVDKMGRTTGWTYGFVNRTCFNTRAQNNGNRVRVNGNLVRMKCQYEANYNSSGGDSGSPVFHWHGSEVTILGVHWGGGAVFSPLGGIQRDF